MLSKFPCSFVCCVLVQIFFGLAFAGQIANTVHGDTINWVEFPSWNPGDTSGSGTSAELSVNTTFQLTSGMFAPDFPAFEDPSITISDPAWPFTNTVVKALRPNTDAAASYSLTYSYLNVGGLPDGGTIAVLDLESPDSSIQFTGLVNGSPVPVNWVVGFFETSGLDADFPSWNPLTNTLQGTTVPQMSFDNFALISPDRSLDEVRLDVIVPDGDGIRFATAAQTIPLAPIWISSSSGEWTDASNWQSTFPPNSSTATAIFGSAAASPITVVVDSPVTVQSIQFGVENDSGATQSYAIAGQSTLTLESIVAADASVNVIDGIHQFQVNVELSADATIDIQTGAQLSFNNRLDLSGQTLTKTGLGTLEINNQLVGSGGSVVGLAGTIAGGGAIGGNVENTGAVVSPGNSAGTLSVSGNYTQASGGTLAVEVGGSDQGTSFDFLDVGGGQRSTAFST